MRERQIMPGPDLDDYVDVAARIAEFREKHPEGSLQQVGVDFRDFAGTSWVIFTAAAYRSPDDPRPGHGTAWEPVPGKTPFTKGSELQNAETAAWGRAIVAVLAADTKRGVATQQEVRNRRAEQQAPDPMIGARDAVLVAAKIKNPDLHEDNVKAWIRALIEQRKTRQTPEAYYELAEVINGMTDEPAQPEAVQS
jgi:hypothetical protein